MKKMCIIICLVMSLSLLPVFSNITEAKTVKKSGWYETAAVKKNYSGYSMGVLKKFKLRGRKLITYGGFAYSNNSGAYKRLKAKKRVFKLSSKCKYIFTAFPSKYNKRVSKKKLFKRVRKSMKRRTTSEGIYIRVKNGKVTRIDYGQI